MNSIYLSWFEICQILLGCVTMIYFGYDKIKEEGWDKVYLFLNLRIINFIKWGKEQSVLNWFEKIRVYIFYIFLCSLALLFLTTQISMLHFLLDIILLIIMLSMFALMSFYSILNFKQESIKLLKWISALVIVFIIIFLPTIYFDSENVIEYIKVITNSQINLSANELYVISFILLAILLVAGGFLSFIIYWSLMGFIPTLILIFIFIVVKSAYFFDRLTKVRRIGTLLIFINIIGLIMNAILN